mgnify:CR=1 FL=1
MKNKPQSISTSDLLEWIHLSSGRLLDIRPVEAFNGWTLLGESRGGHIRGATTVPVKWAHYIDFQDVLHTKDITPDQSIVIYGYDNADAEWLAQKLIGSNYADVRLYPHFLEEWILNPVLPMERLDRYQQLVYPQWLDSLIHNEHPSFYNGKDYVICHSHYGYEEDYDTGHIPGAIPLNTNELESTETWNRRTPEELRTTLLNHGIDQDTTVVVYGRFSFPDNKDAYPGQAAGHLGAIRCAAILLYAGVKDVKILNGGFAAWKEAGMPVSTEPSHPMPKKEFGRTIPGRPELFVDMPEAKELLRSDKGELVSIRSWEEFIGNVSG